MVMTPAGSVSIEDKKRLCDRLARIEGQLRGVRRMIDEESDCEAVVQQLAACRGALNKAFAELLACAIQHQIGSHLEAPEEAPSELEDIVRLITRYG
jgi:DNA-binding FrmR family transcriptional regulator